MKQVMIVYDDRKMPERKIRSITGEKSFGETILKRVPLQERVRQICMSTKNACNFIVLKGNDDVYKLNQEFTNMKNAEKAGASNGCAVLYLYSNFGIRNERDLHFLIQKAAYIDTIYTAKCGDALAAVLFPDRETMLASAGECEDRSVTADQIDQDAFVDLSVQSNFLSYITGGFDARFFNALEGDEYTVTKRSTKKDKIKSEYKFYGMLPDSMKQWFVMPYDYKEDSKGASYTMERIHTTDIAIRYVHGAVSADELSDILDQLFHFLKNRASKKTDTKAAEKVAEECYVEKVHKRIEDLKKNPHYDEFDTMLRMGTSYDGIGEIIRKYESLYRQLRKEAYSRKGHQVSDKALVIGHGDLCFSNILYSREAGLLKLIDPKGAQTEDEMYQDPYYDLAKLSHSVCGGYDFFNSGLYQVALARDLTWQLSIDADLTQSKEVFRSYLESSGYDYRFVRICEAGLFLSMLPLHMDQPGKVFGFLLNAISIMDELG